MGDRRIARELALQALYRIDMLGEKVTPGAGVAFWDHCVPEGVERGGESEQFARELVAGVESHRGRIDELIGEAAEHWQLPRLSRVDLNVLRLATFELLERPDIPASVAINEAIEIARRFGSEDSSGFVNGVLDHIAGVLGVRSREGRAE